MVVHKTWASRIMIAGLILALVASWMFFTVSGGGQAATAQTGTSAAPAAAQNVAQQTAPRKISQVLLVNMQSGREDLHRVNMGLSMVRNQRNAGRQVTLFLNINAPELATTGLPTALRWRDNAPIKDQIAELIGLGVVVLVCPTCSADQGVTAADLVPGAQMSNPTLLGGYLQPGTVTMTY